MIILKMDTEKLIYTLLKLGQIYVQNKIFNIVGFMYKIKYLICPLKN